LLIAASEVHAINIYYFISQTPWSIALKVNNLLASLVDGKSESILEKSQLSIVLMRCK
jgi:hypothetical protein